MSRPQRSLDDYLAAARRASHATGATDNITGRTYLERGKPAVVLIRWSGHGPRNVLLQRTDGTRVVRPFRGIRREAQP